MATKAEQDKAFISAVISADLLEEAIDWIGRNLKPEDVFGDGSLDEWAQDNGWIWEE